MQSGIHTWTFRDRFKEEDFDIFSAIDQAADWGFGSMEIMSGKAQSPPDHIGPEDPDHLGRVMRHAEQAGVTVHCLSTFNDFAYVTDESWRLANVAFIQRWLGIAADLGVPNIRMLTGYYIEGQDRARLEELVRRGIAECIPVAEDRGVNMALENHNSIFFQAEEIVSLIEEFGSPRLTACPDFSNGVQGYLQDEADAAGRDRVIETARVLAPHATNAHMKVAGLREDGSLKGFGGDVDRVVEALVSGGYDGPIHFEAAGKGYDLTAAIPTAKRVLDEAIARVAGG